MNGGFLASDKPLLTRLSTDPPADLPELRRFRYSKEVLIAVRSATERSQSFNELQRVKIGAVACSKAEQRWTSRIGPDGLFSCRETKGSALKPSPTSSPPPGVDERPIRRDPLPHGYANSHHSGSIPPESSPRSSFERDLTGMFQSSPDHSMTRRRSPSPPPKRSEAPNRRSVRTERGPLPVPISGETKSWGNMASSPRDEICFGGPDYKRRSPSPLASPRGHPVSSPRATPASSSYPPGFGPQPTQRNSKTTRAAQNIARDLYYKSRIVRGPNLSENFASRIAYRRGKLSATTDAIVPAIADKREQEPEMLSAVKKIVPGLGAPEGRLAPSVKVEDLNSKATSTRPTLTYNISSDISFEDFSRRLAAEAATDSFIENEAEHDPVKVGEDVPIGVTEATVLQEIVAEEGALASEAAYQQDVDALTKWFGCISTTVEADGDEQAAGMPESHALSSSESASQIDVATIQDRETIDQLDSSVLSFFDTIRSRALLERNDMPTENGGTGGGVIKGGAALGSPSFLKESRTENVRRVDRGLDSESKSSEVERFFQLFTEGKPVYRQGETVLAENHVPSKKQEYHESGSGVLADEIEVAHPESDSGGLERWFAALATGNQLE